MKNKTFIYSVLLAGLLSAVLFTCKKETPKTAPVISVGEVTSITGNTATIKIEMITDGGAAITERGVCWSTNPNPTINDYKAIFSESSGIRGSIPIIKSGLISEGSTNPSGNSITITIENLLPNTTYYIRAYALNSIGVSYSDQFTVTTLTLLPVITTLQITPGIKNTAIGGGNVTDDGGAEITAKGVCWSTNQNSTITDNKTIDGSGTGSYSSSMEGITPGVTYYCRAYSTNSAGTNYGNQVSFTIPEGLPVVYTTSLSIAYTLLAKVISEGSAPVTERGFCWSTSKNPTLNDSKLTCGLGTGPYGGNLTGLTHGVTYYVRAYATNSIGTAYGDQMITVSGSGLCDWYLYEVDTYKNTQITNSPTILENKPRFSFDSKKIYYNVNNDFYSMNRDGSGATLILPNLTLSYDISPDNQKIAHLVNHKLFIMNMDGTNDHQLVNSSLNLSSPVWSPDGQKIACNLYLDPGFYYATLDGQINMITNQYVQGPCSWSPDSKTIAYYKKDSNEQMQIFTFDLINHSEVQRTNLSLVHQPHFSPVGNKILFINGNDIILMNADGSDQRIVYDRSNATSLTWSPDGKKIAFITGDSNVGVIDIDGANFHIINEVPGACRGPVWSPDGKSILYFRYIDVY